MDIYIENLQDKYEFDESMDKIIHEVVDECLKAQGFTISSELNLMLVDDVAIQKINKEQRGIDKPTDVLSFPMIDIFEGIYEPDEMDLNPETKMLMLGDIVISLERTAQQAIEYGHSFKRELAFLLSHGVYHLLGFDHQDSQSEKNMIEKQELVLQKLGHIRDI